jgi:glycosyltransferase involved in cell wall biosynthesis
MTSTTSTAAPDRCPRILCINPGPVPPAEDPRRNALFHLSSRLRGDLITTSWRDRKTHRDKLTDSIRALGGFGYHATLSARLPRGIKTLWEYVFFVTRGLYLSVRNGRYDVVISYGVLTTGLAAWTISLLTGAKLIVEFPGHPWRGLELTTSPLDRLRLAVVRALVTCIARSATGIRLLHPDQLDDLKGAFSDKTAVFHEFVPMSLIQKGMGDGKYVLFLGFPWKLKGVDLLIPAFNSICDQFPEHSLKIVGHCPDHTPWKKLAAGNPRVHLMKAVNHPAAMELVARCSVLALPSRTEGMPRVVTEAMAAEKPVVASAVGGIPHYVKDGVTGLLCAPESTEDLAEKLKEVLSNPELAGKLGKQASEVVRAHYSEVEYTEAFYRMVVRFAGA